MSYDPDDANWDHSDYNKDDEEYDKEYNEMLEREYWAQIEMMSDYYDHMLDAMEGDKDA